MVYPITIAGLRRDLPLCKVNDKLTIAAFVIFGDVELTLSLIHISPALTERRRICMIWRKPPAIRWL